jgi:esterase/lipase superfamily enzyme
MPTVKGGVDEARRLDLPSLNRLSSLVQNVKQALWLVGAVCIGAAAGFGIPLLFGWDTSERVVLTGLGIGLACVGIVAVIHWLLVPRLTNQLEDSRAFEMAASAESRASMWRQEIAASVDASRRSLELNLDHVFAEQLLARADFDQGPRDDPNEAIRVLQRRIQELEDAQEAARQAALEAPEQPVRTQPTDSCEYRVWFGTDRRPNVEDDYLHGFSNEFDKRVHCGSCVVFVPKSHEVGSLGSNPLLRIAKKIVGQPANDPLRLLAIENGDAKSLRQDMSKCLQELPQESREVLLFVHGFNVDFKEAALRAAQIGKDLALPGPMVFYSWPSRGRMFRYGPDETSIGRTKPKFMEFLRILLSVPELRALNVMAHSMGNRLLHEAAEYLEIEQRSTPAFQFGHIILAAPDVDRETFKQAALAYSRLRSAQRRTTLYWNRSDRAVGLSGILHGAPRIGHEGAGISHTDSILWVSSAFSLDWLGHGYFADAKPVLDDMKRLLHEHAPPNQRPNLTPFPSDHPLWWELRWS